MASSFSNTGRLASGPSITPRNIFATVSSGQLEFVTPGSILIDSARTRDSGQAASSNPTSLLRPGLILGKVTASGKYANSIVGVLPAPAVNTATTLNLQPAVATEVQRYINANGTSQNFIITSPTQAAGTVVQTVVSATGATVGTNTSNSYMTLSGSLGLAAVTGGLVQPNSGAGAPLTILADSVYPTIDLNDSAGNNQDQALCKYLRGGDLLATAIINLKTDDWGVTVDSAVVTWLKAQLVAKSQNFSFSDDR